MYGTHNTSYQKHNPDLHPPTSENAYQNPFSTFQERRCYHHIMHYFYGFHTNNPKVNGS